MAVDLSTNKSYNPFYRNVDGPVIAELNRRATAYGARVRSERVRPGEKGFPEADRLLWSYGKTAYALITAGGITLGGSYERVMSDRKGDLKLYDTTRNQPKYPLLQSLELSNEGTIGSLLKGSFTFTVYPDISNRGFNMGNLENAFFTPGNEVNIKYGWSVKDGGPNNGEFTGIINNFDWSVNGDLSITAKCSVVAKATIAIGISGEQTNPDSADPKEDPLGKPIQDGDLAGLIEKDVKALGGVNNKSIGEGSAGYYDRNTTSGLSKKLSYYVIGMPMSLADTDDNQLNSNQKVAKSQYKKQVEIAEKKTNLSRKYGSKIKEDIRKLNEANSKDPKDQATIDTINKSLEATKAELKKEAISEGIIQTGPSTPGTPDQYDELWEQSKNVSREIIKSEDDKTGATPNPTTGKSQYSPPQPPKPITQAIYYVKLGDLAEFINEVTSKTEIGKKLFKVQCFGNFTQNLGELTPSVVSSAPEKVFFPSPTMGKYNDFDPFAGNDQLAAGAPAGHINIGNILISTTTIIEVYRSFISDNQTSIEYKNITEFFNKLIEQVNYASGEMYQLVTQLIDPPKANKNLPATLAIEDSNITTAVANSVTPYGFYATIAKPLLKSVNVQCKPPGPAAAATFVQGRAGETAEQVDVRYTANKYETEFNDAKTQIESAKNNFKSNGAGSSFSTGLKGNYAKYKRSTDANDKTHWLTKVIYPVDLSLTIDGIDGFKFGDVIETNLIPTRYNEERMVFVVTKVNHSIQNGIWETTLSTKARIEPGKLLSK